MPIQTEYKYLHLLSEVLKHGERRTNRTGTDTISLFGPQLSIDLRSGFPLMTTKRVWFKGVAVELDWMLKGSNNVAYLQQHGVKIWDAWSRASYRPEMGLPEGDLGPIYGVQWRHWNTWSGWIDQIAMIVDKLRHHRDDRRIILSAWNVAQIEEMKLPPCHYAAQFLVDNSDGLTCIMSIRSWDLFLGAPFNIAQYALLTHILAKVSGLVPHRLVVNAGDAHIYVNHVDQVREQLLRVPRKLPTLELADDLHEIDDFTFEKATIVDYDHHPALKGEIAV